MHTRLGDRGGHVSIHTPTKGVTVCLPIFQSVLLGFNPHTHEGCDIQARWVRAQRAVSIHTPTKGVTYRLRKQGCIIYVSIHTPTKGVTFALRCKHKQSDCFNPHTHEGCDSKPSPLSLPPPGFNPHTHEGCDVSTPTIASVSSTFQSTHPRRV